MRISPSERITFEAVHKAHTTTPQLKLKVMSIPTL